MSLAAWLEAAQCLYFLPSEQNLARVMEDAPATALGRGVMSTNSARR
jgi:hypothetical protein